MRLYLFTKFKVSSIIPASFRQWVVLHLAPSSRPLQTQPQKIPSRLGWIFVQLYLQTSYTLKFTPVNPIFFSILKVYLSQYQKSISFSNSGWRYHCNVFVERTWKSLNVFIFQSKLFSELNSADALKFLPFSNVYITPKVENDKKTLTDNCRKAIWGVTSE